MQPTARADYRFAFQQDRLSEICGDLDRQLETPELHPANDYYGQASVLKRYAGLDPKRSLRFVVEHGVHLDDIVWSLDMTAPLGAILSCSPWRAQIHRENSNKVAIPAGFGYLYAIEVVRETVGADPSDDQRCGTLAFPCHSTHSITSRFDHRDYAQQLVQLPAEFQPVYLCGYWKDILDGSLTEYQEQGIKIVTCGHMYDPDFMLRFHDLCRQFRYSVSNKLGTHLFQSVASGCRFFFLHSSEIEFDIPEQDRPHCGQFNPLFLQAESRALELFDSPQPEITQDQQQFVDRYIGTDYQLSRHELRRLIRRLEWSDRMVPRWTQLPEGETVFAPPAVARKSIKPIKKWSKLKRSVTKRLPRMRRAA